MIASTWVKKLALALVVLVAGAGSARATSITFSEVGDVVSVDVSITDPNLQLVSQTTGVETANVILRWAFPDTNGPNSYIGQLLEQGGPFATVSDLMLFANISNNPGPNPLCCGPA